MTSNKQIVSLNVGYGMLIDDLLPYIRTLSASTSVFCFQEMDLPTRIRIDKLLLPSFDGYYATKVTTRSTFHLITYVRKTLSVTKTRRLLDDIKFGGLALSCSIEDGLQRLTITNVHGEPQPGHKLDTETRIVQSRELIRSSLDTQEPQIVIGDFNLLPETESIRLFSNHGFNNLIDEFEIPTTRNKMVWKRYPDNIQLYADYAFIRSDEPIEYDFRVDSNIVSDHQPLILYVATELPIEIHTSDHDLTSEPAKR